MLSKYCATLTFTWHMFYEMLDHTYPPTTRAATSF